MRSPTRSLRDTAIEFVCHSVFIVVTSTLLASLAYAQNQAARPDPFDASERKTVELNFQGPVKLDVFLNYLSNRLGIRFEYSTAVGNREISLRALGPVPVATLPSLLASILRTESLVLIDSDVAGWKRVVDVGDMVQFAPVGEAPKILAEQGVATPVTQVFVLETASATSLATVLKPFLTEPGSNLLSIPDSNVLIVTDYAPIVRTISDLLEVIDRPDGQSTYEIYNVRNLEAEMLASQVEQILSKQIDERAGSVRVIAQAESNRIVVAGKGTLVDRSLQLLQQMDISRGMTTKVYRPRNTTAERIDKLATGFLNPQDAKSSYQSTIDEDGNLLIVRATSEVHEQLAQLLAEIDVPLESSESPIQFYKLKNASAIDVLYTLLALQDAYGQGVPTGGVVPAAFYSPLGGYGVPAFGLGGSQGNPLIPNNGLQTTRLPLTPGLTGNDRDGFMPENTNPLARPTLATGQGMNGSLPANGSSNLGGGLAGPSAGVASLPGGARVSADVSTNSLIVVAPASAQSMYAELIKSLDQRRPQVLIEAKIIAVDTSDDFSLGVEVSLGDRSGAKRLFKFTSFGLSEVDPTTGALEIIPGLGFNGTLVDPDVADVVVRALSSHRRARVLAAPKILVNDNSTGKLESVNSIPFSSVNASQTVSTTSLGGDQQAGTIITATPHINENDHLQLDFDVEFSTFSGTATDGLPPPRQIDRVGSTVTIPDGKTVVVGGLKRVSDSDTFIGVPWAEKIPIVRELTSRTDRSRQTTSFFLFIRPIILRDSRFSDLRFLSDKDAQEFCVPGDYPVSRPELLP